MNDLLQDDARDAGVATLVELLDYRAATRPTTSSSASSAATASRMLRSHFRSFAHARAPSPPRWASMRHRAIASCCSCRPGSSTSRPSSAACTRASSRCPRIRPTRVAPTRACTASSRTRRRASRSSCIARGAPGELARAGRRAERRGVDRRLVAARRREIAASRSCRRRRISRCSSTRRDRRAIRAA